MIVGAGSIGLMYASRLARAGISVSLVTRSAGQASALNKYGITLEEQGKKSQHPIPAFVMGSLDVLTDEPTGFWWPNDHDWIWLTVKQTHLDSNLISQLSSLTAQGASLLCLQNGIGHMEKLGAALPNTPLYAAISTEGALRMDDTTVIHTGQGRLTVGAWPKSLNTGEQMQKMLLESLDLAGIDAELSNEMVNRLYDKLLINAVINPLTAIYGVKNGDLPQDPVRLKLMMAVHAESEAILTAAGWHSPVDSWERLLSVCKQTARNESSMLRDVKAGRLTEADWINGGIAALAKRLHIPAPLNDAMTVLIKSLII
ncbi:ketopantoate reductase family protein [Paenibacillus solisilvae]|uniref:2-dehydropantoate 2-reductase n=1 Tax=Paenibacillus solisilvae TaxID=2486751 RepID=A0ABW0W3R5_9BACL